MSGGVEFDHVFGVCGKVRGERLLVHFAAFDRAEQPLDLCDVIGRIYHARVEYLIAVVHGKASARDICGDRRLAAAHWPCDRDQSHFASNQLSPVPMSAINGTASEAAPSISRLSILATASVSASGASTMSSSCTCMINPAFSPASLSARSTAIIAFLMMSDAVP